ncbi:MAG: FkbM family methyltransferase [Fimbriimonadales bacterium]|nr:MAG: FkbM family methyltransferase [Fimbriimonadales bacterium]
MASRVRPFKALRALRYVPYVVNWAEVLAAYYRNRDVQRLHLRSGVRLEAEGSVPLMRLFKEVWRDDCYRLRAPRLSLGATVIDIGANVGLFAIYAAINFAAKVVYCFEPSATAVSSLRKNIEANGLEGRIQVFRFGVAGAKGTREFLVSPTEVLNRICEVGSTAGSRVVIECVTLQDVFELCRVERCDFLKVDCEGAEYEIFLSAPPGLLKRFQRIAIEWHTSSTNRPEELVSILQNAGFRVALQRLPRKSTGYIYAQRGFDR